LNPRPLGYEPHDVCLWRLGQSLADVVTSADKPGPISVGRLRLPRLVLSRCVRFTNRFTEQAIDLQFPAPLRILPWLPSPGARHRVRTRQATAKRTRPRHATRRLRSCRTPGRAAAQASSPPPGLRRGTDRTAVCPDLSPEPDCTNPCTWWRLTPHQNPRIKKPCLGIMEAVRVRAALRRRQIRSTS